MGQCQSTCEGRGETRFERHLEQRLRPGEGFNPDAAEGFRRGSGLRPGELEALTGQFHEYRDHAVAPSDHSARRRRTEAVWDPSQ